jgi:hypothetical protein
MNGRFIAAAALFVWLGVEGKALAQLPPLNDAPDSVAVADTTDTLAQGQTAAAAGTQTGPKKLKIVRRNYEYRRQLGMALAMMAFVALIFTSTQNWNPG